MATCRKDACDASAIGSLVGYDGYKCAYRCREHLLDALQSNSGYRVVRELDSHPVPFEQDEIDRLWSESDHLDDADAPHVDEAHDTYVDTIAEYGSWHVFETRFPFDVGGVVCWNQMSSEAFRISMDCGGYHELVNLFAEVVDAEGDCRASEYANSTMPSGSTKQRCENCGRSWTV